MKVDIKMTRAPLSSRGVSVADGRCGALVEFAGVVRKEEGERIIEGLDYEAYEPMARLEMGKILQSLAGEFPCDSVEVQHRVGLVPAGEASVIVRVESKHRAEAFGLLAAFMDRLKADVPIWKSVP
jgi:molybdopterin synthase catalytic subunit